MLKLLCVLKQMVANKWLNKMTEVVRAVNHNYAKYNVSSTQWSAFTEGISCLQIYNLLTDYSICGCSRDDIFPAT